MITRDLACGIEIDLKVDLERLAEAIKRTGDRVDSEIQLKATRLATALDAAILRAGQLDAAIVVRETQRAR